MRPEPEKLVLPEAIENMGFCERVYGKSLVMCTRPVEAGVRVYTKLQWGVKRMVYEERENVCRLLVPEV